MQTAEMCLVLVSGQQDNSFSDNNQAAEQQPRNTFFGKSLRNGVKFDCFQTERGLYYRSNKLSKD